MSAKFTLTITADSADDMLDMLAKINAGAAAAAPEVETTEKRGRGRPPKATTAPAPIEPPTVEAPPPPAPAVVVTPPTAPVPAGAVAVGGEAPTKEAVTKVLIDVVTKLGKPACTALCQRHGSPTGNLTGLPVSSYAAVMAEAASLLAVG